MVYSLPPNPALHLRAASFLFGFEIAHLNKLIILMTDFEQIENIRQLTLAQLADLRANPKPTYSIDGQTVSWSDYINSLQLAVDWCDAKLIGLAPFEVQSQAFT